jgi:hypothetical protein
MRSARPSAAPNLVGLGQVGGLVIDPRTSDLDVHSLTPPVRQIGAAGIDKGRGSAGQKVR